MKLSFLVVAALPVIFLLSGCGAKAVEAPASFEPFVAIDKSFAGSGPAGWEKGEFGGGETYAKTVFVSGAAKIEIKSDTANSFIGDIAKSAGKKPVDAVHEKILANLGADKGSDFSAQATETTSNAFGEGRLTEWTGGGLHGLRATAMSTDRSIGLNCECTEANWDALKPAFTKVWSELKPATP